MNNNDQNIGTETNGTSALVVRFPKQDEFTTIADKFYEGNLSAAIRKCAFIGKKIFDTDINEFVSLM
jgi:hypothetical protein